MKLISWSTLATLVVGLVLLFMGLTTAGRLVLFVAGVIQLIYSALAGKKTNAGTR